VFFLLFQKTKLSNYITAIAIPLPTTRYIHFPVSSKCNRQKKKLRVSTSAKKKKKKSRISRPHAVPFSLEKKKTIFISPSPAFRAKREFFTYPFEKKGWAKN
jgi:hypothetical protein